MSVSSDETAYANPSHRCEELLAASGVDPIQSFRIEILLQSLSARMPFFYFHLRTPAGLDRDQIGANFASLEEAYLDAFDAVGTMTVELTRQKANPRQYGFEITDGAGSLLLELPFAEYLDQGRLPLRPPTSFQLQQAANELRARREIAANALTRHRSLQAAVQEQGAVLQASLAETKRLLAEAQRISAALRPLQHVGSKV